MTNFTVAAQGQRMAQDPTWLASLASYAGFPLLRFAARATSYNVGPAVRTIASRWGAEEQTSDCKRQSDPRRFVTPAREYGST